MRSIVKELDDSRSHELWKVRRLPTQFQAFIDGVNIRVHVVGREVFATAVESEAVDYRYAQRDGHGLAMSPTKLPRAVAARCRRLSEVLDLPLCGIDLKRTPDGDYYCFEVNPSPAYSFYEEHTGQPISEAIVRYLRGAQA